MQQSSREVLHALYSLEQSRLQVGDYEGWCTPEQIALALPDEHLHRGDTAWTRAQLDALWLAKRILLVPDGSGTDGTAEGVLTDVTLSDLDCYGDEDKLAAEADDCRACNVATYEQVVIYPERVSIRCRSRVAEIARLLSRNYDRFSMAPSTGVLRYERRPQERPERNVPVMHFLEELNRSVTDGHIAVEIQGVPQRFALDNAVAREPLTQAVVAVLESLAEIMGGREPGLSEFQVSSIRAALCGLYSRAFRRQFRAHVITAGVGAGKSYAFQVAALVHVTYRALQGRRGAGVLLLYPRVALAGNQFKDLFLLVEKINGRVSQEIRTILDAGQQLTQQLGILPDEAGGTYRAIEQVYGGDYALVISNLDTLANRLIHPQSCRGLTEHIDLVVLDEIHLLSGLYGSHARMVLKRLQALRTMWRLRRQLPTEPFEALLNRRATVEAPYCIGASATIAEPRDHLARVLAVEPDQILHLNAEAPLQTGWVHHMFLRQRVEASSMSATVNATSCVIHNRRNGLFRDYYQNSDQAGRREIALSDLPNPVQPGGTVGLRDSAEIHKAIGFSDSLDNIGRWADLVADNEFTRDDGMCSRANPQGKYPYFMRFQEPLWRIPHHLHFGQQQQLWQRRLRTHYGQLCFACKQGRRGQTQRIPPGITVPQCKTIERLWDFSVNNDESYLAKLGVKGELRAAGWFEPLRRAGTAPDVANLDNCPFFQCGLCWWWSADHAGSNAPAPVTAQDPLNGVKMPAPRADRPHHFVNGIRVMTFTSRNDFDVMKIRTINDIFGGKADRVFRTPPGKRFGDDVRVNVSLVIGSPRLEVGVDLSKVQDGLTFHAMRDPASVQQKVGRVGRELNADSLVVHILTQNARDQYYFRNPHILLDPDFLQPVPLHEDNRIIARHHFFMAIVDFLCLQGEGPSPIADKGHRLDLINDHSLPTAFSNWHRKVEAVYAYLFGNHPKQAQNLQNLKEYLACLGAREEDLHHPGEAARLTPSDAPCQRNVGVVDVFQHEFGPKFFLMPIRLPDASVTTLAEIASYTQPFYPHMAPLDLPERHKEFLRTYNEAPPGEAPSPKRNRSYLWNLMTLPVFRRGIPRLSIPGDQPFVWAPNLFSAVGNEVVRVYEITPDGQTAELGYETVGRAISLLLPGTLTYRFRASPRKVPVGGIISPGMPVEWGERLQAVYLDIGNREFFQPADNCPIIGGEDLPADYDTQEPLSVYTPRQIPVIPASREPRARFADGMLGDGDSRPWTPGNDNAIDLPSPPRCFALIWYRIDRTQAGVPISCRFCERLGQYSAATMLPFPTPPVLSVFDRVHYHPALNISEFAWGLDRQFATRSVDPARLIYRGNVDGHGDQAVALGHSFSAPAIEFVLKTGPESLVGRLIDDVVSAPASGVYQSCLFQYLHFFLRTNALQPRSPAAPPWVPQKRPTAFITRDLKAIILFHLLNRWHPDTASGQVPPTPPVFDFAAIRGCFDPNHPNYLTQPLFRNACDLLAAERDAIIGVQHADSLFAHYSNYVEACQRIAVFTIEGFKTHLIDVLVNTVATVLRQAALRLTGAEDDDLGYFYKCGRDDCSFYLFDTDALGNGTAELVRDHLFISDAERVLMEKLAAFGNPIDPLPTMDLAVCFEEELTECQSSQATLLSFHSVPCDDPSLQDLLPQVRAEKATVGKVLDFARDTMGLSSFDHLLPFQLCPEFLSRISRYNVYGGHALVGGSDYPTFQSLQSALSFCVSGCLACVLNPEQNLHGSLNAHETVNKLLLNAFYERLVSNCVQAEGSLRYPGTGSSRTVAWEEVGAVEASNTGRVLPGNEYELDLPVRTDGSVQRVPVTPSARPAPWTRLLRANWQVAPEHAPRFRPRMSF